MAQINVNGLTFCYEGSFDNIFENVSFSIDTDWKLGFIGRNGKGKTTFFKLLMGMYEYIGNISTNTTFDYFPYKIDESQMENDTIDIVEKLHPDYELWKICRELELLKTDAEILYRPYRTLSHGERTKVMLAVLFSRDNEFLLIDEPTNHLDMPTREMLVEYLKHKKGFILVSHDRWFLDNCIDHVLVLNRSTITVEKGNFSSWWEDKDKRDRYEKAENEKLKKEIGKLKAAARQSAEWADKVERTKIGFNPNKEHDRFIDTRAYIGEKSKRMQKRSKNLENRQNKAIEEKEKLLKDIENLVQLKLMPLKHHKQTYIQIKDYSLAYGSHMIFKDLDIKIECGERVILSGGNGCGKSSIIKSIFACPEAIVLNMPPEMDAKSGSTDTGLLQMASGLRISYINQDTSYLSGSLNEYIKKIDVDESLFKAILRQLDFERVQFEKNMENYSEGQKKKVLIAGSLLQKAHLYIWDEPLNYIDVFSRMQIEQLILKYQPTMLIVEHDKIFCEHIGTKVINFMIK